MEQLEKTSRFKLHSEYQPTGDQPAAIEALVKGFRDVFRVVRSVSKLTSFSSTFDTKIGNLD